MKRSPIAFLQFVVGFTVLVIANVYGQVSDSPGSVNCSATVNLTVTVTDITGGAVIPNALVILREDTLGESRTAKIFKIELRTEENGKASAAVPCNYLDVFVGHDGFAPVAKKILVTRDADTVSVPLEMYSITRTTEVLVPGVEPSAVPLPSTITTAGKDTPEVRVPDSATALKIAEPVLIKTYGKRQVNYERPLTAKLDSGVWTIYGTLCCPDSKGHRTCKEGKCLGGVAVLKLRQTDGKVLSVEHYK